MFLRLDEADLPPRRLPVLFIVRWTRVYSSSNVSARLGGGGVFTLLAAAMAAEFGASGVGRAFGMIMFFIPVGSLAPFAIARTQETTGSYAPALAGMMLLVMLSGVLRLLLRERRR
jgi:hypothetical protein